MSDKNFIIDAVKNIDEKYLANYYSMKQELLKSKKEQKTKIIKLTASIAASLILVVGVMWGAKSIQKSNRGSFYSLPPSADLILWGETVGESISNEDINEVVINMVWNGKTVSDKLYAVLESAKDNDWIALNVSVYGGIKLTEYVFNEKTIAQWKKGQEECRRTLELLADMEKEGDYIKLGEKLYTEGAVDGTKYSRSFYEERLEYYGSDFLSKYIVDGEFLLNKLISDRETINNYEKEIGINIQNASKQYKSGENNTYYNLLKQNGYNAEIKKGSLFLFVTKAQFFELDIADISGCYFSLALRKAFDGADIPTLETDTAKLAVDKMYIGSLSGDGRYIQPKTDKEAADLVQKLVEKWFYTYDCLEYNIMVDEGVDENIFDIIKAEKIYKQSSNSYILTVKFENIELEGLAKISHNEKVREIFVLTPMTPESDGEATND